MIIFIGFTLLSLSNVPKSFEVIGESAKTIVLEENEKLEISEIKFKNTTEQNLSLKWTLVENSFPKEWDYSMCAFGKCQIVSPAETVSLDPWVHLTSKPCSIVSLLITCKNKESPRDNENCMFRFTKEGLELNAL